MTIQDFKAKYAATELLTPKYQARLLAIANAGDAFGFLGDLMLVTKWKTNQPNFMDWLEFVEILTLELQDVFKE